MSVTSKIVLSVVVTAVVAVGIALQPWVAMPGALRFGLAIAVAAVLAGSLVRGVAGSLDELAAFVRDVAAGERARRLSPGGDDALARLAHDLDAMTDELQRGDERASAEVSQKTAVLAAMDEGLLGLDGEGRIVLVNQAAIEMLGWDEGDPTGRRIEEITRAPEILESAEQCLEEGRRARSEMVVPGSMGDAVLQIQASPIGDSPTVRAALVLHDVTEIRRLENVRRDFVANVSHELKTPLTSMRGYLEAVIEDTDMPESTREHFLRKVGLNTARLGSIVSDLLDLARLEDEAGRLRKQPLDFGELVATCVQRAQADAEVHGVGLELHPSPGAVTVLGDRSALATAVSNLLTNAIKYTPEHGRVNVRVAVAGGKARVDVEDDGPGIARHEQERIFERFYRVDKNRSRSLGGTGLGLSIVRNVARNHGGDVSLRSAPGEGSTFTIQLPCTERPAEAAAG